MTGARVIVKAAADGLQAFVRLGRRAEANAVRGRLVAAPGRGRGGGKSLALPIGGPAPSKPKLGAGFSSDLFYWERFNWTQCKPLVPRRSTPTRWKRHRSERSLLRSPGRRYAPACHLSSSSVPLSTWCWSSASERSAQPAPSAGLRKSLPSSAPSTSRCTEPQIMTHIFKSGARFGPSDHRARRHHLLPNGEGPRVGTLGASAP
jgi:hypothetical protein